MMGARLMNLVSLAAVLIAAGMLALAGARWVAQRPQFDFKRIEVRGELQHVTAASIRAAIAGRLRGNFFTVRLDDARRLLESVPWVAQASVRRVWPDRLRVTLREYRALGAWDDGRLLSDGGELFVANVAEAEVFGPLPALGGPDDSAREVAHRYYEFAAGLAPLSMTIDAIEVSERRSWTVRATASEIGSTTFVLGRNDRPDVVQQRLTDAVTAFPMVFARLAGAPERIDTRYANGLSASPPARGSEPRNR